MEKKYGKLNKNSKKIKHFMLSKMKKQQNQLCIPDFRGMQEILWKPTENKAVRHS